MGDGKRKSETETEMEKVEKIQKVEKIEKVEPGSARYEELRDDLFREAAKLVSEDPSRRIAILISPSSESDTSIHAFGYPSAEGVVQTFLDDKRPVPIPEDAEEENDEDDDDDGEEEDDEQEDPWPSRFWWDDPTLQNSTNPEELKAAIDEMSSLRNHLRAIRGVQGSGNQEDLNNDKAGPKP